MDTNTVLTFLQVVIGALGVLIVVIAWAEYSKVRALRDDVRSMLDDIKKHQRKAQKAQQRIIASYGVKDSARKIALIQSAIESDPDTFNGYNALGYALLESGEGSGAIAAFMQATVRHPKAKEGWIDLAAAYRGTGDDDQAKRAVWKAIEVDDSAHSDIAEDDRLKDLLE